MCEDRLGTPRSRNTASALYTGTAPLRAPREYNFFRTPRKKSAERLGLKPGAEAYAIVKASVMIGVD
jgi:hypothetical protein